MFEIRPVQPSDRAVWMQLDPHLSDRAFDRKVRDRMGYLLFADGVPAGFNVALMNAISDKMGAAFTFVQVEADARLSALSSGKIDVIFWYGNVQGYTSERDELLITDEYYEDNVYYVTKSFDMNRVLEAMKAQ